MFSVRLEADKILKNSLAKERSTEMNITPTDTHEPSQGEQSKTESWIRKALKNFGAGAATGSGIAFPIIIMAQISQLGKDWFSDTFFIFFDIVVSPLVGIPIGGIGGLILGSIWKHRRAAIIGGAFSVLILAPLIYVLFSSCGALGGC
jgi:Fe2+ transport system protein B